MIQVNKPIDKKRNEQLSNKMADNTCSFMTSPQAGAPTRPVPTFTSLLSREPTFRGFS